MTECYSPALKSATISNPGMFQADDRQKLRGQKAIDENQLERFPNRTTGRPYVIQFTTPGVADLPDGEYDVRVLSSSGQAATSLAAFKVVPPPVVDSIDPTSGSAAGGFTVTIRGSNFSETPNGMIVKYRNRATNQVVARPIRLTSVSATELRFEEPLEAGYAGNGAGEF